MNFMVNVETFNLEEAAMFLRLNSEVLRRKVLAGEIPGAKTGKGWLFVNIDLVNWLRTQYPDKRQEPQGAEDDKEKPSCHSSNAATSGTFTSSRRTENEYEKALGLETKKKRKSTTTG